MTGYNWLRDYCEKSTSHCVEYFVMKHRSLIEKCYWLVTFCLMTTLTTNVMRIILNIWIDNPSVIFFENKESGIREIPFPLITICPSYQLRTWVWDKHKNTNTSYWKHLQQYRSMVCLANYYSNEFNISDKAKYLNDDIVSSLLKDCAISCSEIFQFGSIKWQNLTVQNFCQYVQPIISPSGICYSINMLPAYQMFNAEYYRRYMKFFSKNNSFMNTDSTKWNLDDGYSSYGTYDFNTVPARTNGITYYNGFSFTLNSFKEEFLNCPNENTISDYYIITVSNPTEYYSNKIGSFIVPGSDLKIQIIPSVKKISSDLKWRSLGVRKCYLHNERKLFIFDRYSQNNCEIECIINETISMCDCIKFEWACLATADMKICGPAKQNCLIRTMKSMFQPEMQNKCKCLPTCSVLEYEISESSSYDNNWTYLKTSKLSNSSRGSQVEIVFHRPHFTAYITASVLDLDSLISVTGGVISLFLGINIYNLFEMLYVVLQIIINHFMSTSK